MTPWIQTLNGKRFDLLDPRPEQVGDLFEIATALAHKARFTGQTREPYSVAQHCVLGARQLGERSPFAAAFLLHELGEVYLPDIASPLKPHLDVDLGVDGVLTWKELEDRHMRVILHSLDLISLLGLISTPEVQTCDLRMLMTEARDLLAPPPEPWQVDAPPFETLKIVTWSAQAARDAWIREFEATFR